MKIIINATAHNNQESMREYYTEQLQKKFSKYQFINSLEVWVKKVDDKEYEVSMLANPKKVQNFLQKEKATMSNSRLLRF